MKIQRTQHGAVTAILLGGGLAATLDIAYAMLRYNPGNPLSILQSVAAGWLGREAMQSGWAGGLLGLGSHFAILIVAAGVFYFASRRLPILRERWLLSGAVFGVLIYCFMNFVVLPLSAYPFQAKYSVGVLVEGFLSHALLVGMPIAWACAKTRATDYRLPTAGQS